MKRVYKNTFPHQKMMRRLGYLYNSALSACLLLVLLVLPVAPVFGSEPQEPALEGESSAEIIASDSTQGDEGVSEHLSSKDAESIETEEQSEGLDESSSEGDVDEILNIEVENVGDSTTVTDTEGGDDFEETVGEEEDAILDSSEVGEVKAEGREAGLGHSDTDIELGDILEDSDDVTVEADVEKEDAGVDAPVDDEDGLNQEEVTEDTLESGLEEEFVENMVVVGTVTNDENLYSFSKNECTVIGDGSFYCAKVEEATTVTYTDRIFSAPDADGDKEIFVEREGQIVQFTNNADDDDAPHYDAVSDSVVWHRLIDGRYQVIAYSFKDKEEVQLTNESYNSMEPTRHGDVTVWQSWVKNNWEIMFFEDGEVTQLTNNDTPDISPSINKNYIVWQSQKDGAWSAQVYDRATGDIETIANSEGLSIENARFVLVYDTKHENGDVEMRGYDLKTKRTIPLAVLPASVPEELPEPDQTGEDRALVQTLAQVKPKVDEEDLLSGDDDLDDVPNATSTSSAIASSTIADIVIPNESSTNASAANPVDVPATSTAHISELVIEPIMKAATSDNEYAHIEDVVLPPFVSTPDPQEDIASDS